MSCYKTDMEGILAIDQGTHASRTLLFDTEGRLLGQACCAIGLCRHSEIYIEQNAEEILNSVRTVVAEAVRQAPCPIRAAALTTQRSTLVAWDRQSGQPLAPAISWQDRRSHTLLAHLAGHEEEIRRISGLPLSPHYLAGKMRWLLENDVQVASSRQTGTLLMGPLASFLTFHLLEESPFIADHSNAARSLLFDPEYRQWSELLLRLFDIPEQILPVCHPTLDRHGMLKGYGIPLTCLCGDQNAAIYAQGEPEASTATINIGSGAFVLRLTDSHIVRHPHMLTGIASSHANCTKYLLEGTVNGAGAALSALFPNHKAVLQKLPQWLQEVSAPPVFLNGIDGLGSPWWRDDFDSTFIPDDGGEGERAVAVVESIVFLLQHNLRQLANASTVPLSQIMISGGLSQLNGLCQRVADLSGMKVVRHTTPEATATGAAWLAAGRPAGWRFPAMDRIFEPASNPALQQRFNIFTCELNKRL
ncbi:MAG: FGGY family carbohydrate kinase [Mariprofundaceae bacterium]